MEGNYIQDAYGRGVKYLLPAGVTTLVGGTAAYGLNILLNSGKITWLTKLVYGSESCKTAIFAGGFAIAFGGLIFETLVPHKHEQGKRNWVPLVGMLASIPVNIYVFKANTRQAAVFALVGILANEALSYGYKLRG